MSLLDGLFAYETSVSDLLNPELWLENAAGGSRTQSGEIIGPYSSLSIAAYFAAIRAISEDVAKLPLVLYRGLEPRGKERVKDHPVYRLLHDAPNPQQTSMAFRETMMAHTLGWGGGFAKLYWDGTGNLTEMRILHPGRTTVHRETNNTLRYKYVNPNGGGEEWYGERDILHIRGLGDDGVTGYSVARVAAESLGVSMAAQTFGASFFGNSTMPCGVLTVPGALKDKAFQHLRESWATQYQGANRAAKPAILEEGMKWEKMSIPPEEAQYLQTRQFQIEEIARWFRMPPHKLQHLLRSNYNSIEQLAIEYVQDTLLPWLVRWEQTIKQRLLAGQGEEELFVKHTVQGLLRGDQAGRSASYSTLFQIGAMSQNDIRELEDMNPVEDGDTYYVPSNLTRSEDAAQGKVASAAGGAPNFPPRSEPEEEEEEEEPPEDEDEDTEDDDTEEESEASAILDPIWQDVAARVLNKELRAVTRAAVKYQDIPSAWHGWLDDFYGELEKDIAEMATPGALAISTAKDLDRETVAEALREIAHTHVLESRLLLAQSGNGSQVELATTSWVPERQNKLAASLKTRLTHV